MLNSGPWKSSEKFADSLSSRALEHSARPSAHHAADDTLLEAREAETFAPQRRVLLLEQPHVAREGVAFGRQLGEHL